MDSHPVTNALYNRIVCDVAPVLGSDAYELLRGFSPAAADTAGVTVQEFQALALVNSITKKFQDEIPKSSPDAVALQKFLDANSRCFNWVKPSSDGSYSSEYELELYGEFIRVLDKALFTVDSYNEEKFPFFDWETPLDWTRIAFFGTNGPHMALGASNCSFLDKFEASCITYTREFLWDLFNCRVQKSDLWRPVEEKRDLTYGHELVPHAKLTFVAKTVSESRCICIEPALNIFFQKGVEFLLLGVLQAHFGIDLSNQQAKNAQLAFQGSSFGTYGTIDLSSASDTISLKMLEAVLPRSVYQHLVALRSPAVKLPNGEVLDLGMVSTMGNGFTFPLQTIIFAAAVEAVYNCHNLQLRKPRGPLLGNFGVNGDDIIVVTECYKDVVRLLQILGFTVNDAKSFNEGNFRESCGADFYKGQPVRGVYCKTLATKQDCYSLINRLNRWSAVTGILLPSTIRWLTDKAGRKLFVPPSEADTAGIHAPLAVANPTRDRSSDITGKPYYGNAGYIYQFYSFRSSGIDPFADERYSHLGIFLAAVKGECRGGTLLRRDDEGHFSLRFGRVPGWDTPRRGCFSNREAFNTWISVVLILYGKVR